MGVDSGVTTHTRYEEEGKSRMDLQPGVLGELADELLLVKKTKG